MKVKVMMSKKGFIILFFGLVLTYSASGQIISGAETYTNYCSACHGQQMEGGRASALIKEEWKHGNDRKALIKNITEGIPSTEMPAWNGILTTKEIEAIAEYILKAQKKPTNEKKPGKS